MAKSRPAPFLHCHARDARLAREQKTTLVRFAMSPTGEKAISFGEDRVKVFIDKLSATSSGPMTESIIKRIHHKIRHRLVLQVILDNLRHVGLGFFPFYVYCETLAQAPPESVTDSFSEFKAGFLGREDMKALTRIPGRRFTEQEFIEQLDRGLLCFGAKYRGEIAIFTWINVETCHTEYYPLKLKANEAYLFDTYALKKYRGRGLSVWLRCRLYEELAKMGREVCYSLVICTNTPSNRFKRKLNARRIKLGLYIELFHRWRKAWILRNCE